MNTHYSPLSEQHPIWAMAFRPFYLLTALYGAFSILLWGFGYQGTSVLPAFLWHAHEMIWGYSGGIVVAFLLTAVATWTGQPPVRGRFLMVLVTTWLLARLSAFLPILLPTALFGTLFYWLGTYAMGLAVWQSRNSRNYIAVLALFMLGLSHAVFHGFLFSGSLNDLHSGLTAGIVMVAGFIGLIGNRVIPFFTARRLNTPQISSPMPMVIAALCLPLIAAVLMMLGVLLPAAGILAVAAGILGMIQTYRWFEKGILREPLLWTLHLGYGLSSLGLLLLGMGQFNLQVISLGTHLLAVGGIGLLTVSMMTRTALGHTGRPLYPAPKWMPTAFYLMLAATFFRALAAIMAYINPTAYTHSLRLSAVLFAASLLLYFLRYLPWLTAPRIDGRAG
ncbi:MAG: NnrS family protein [Alysiella sp.]|uniref:NnrS family protein n=1 Tax=Alysiella sp. TaxID=1872483 RepID=UPI0026DB2DDC|nr:NnrS family protein [Alysiella sp.]MDO4433846.1 NnrS family protein [Alysiella sp.]